ncbi:4-oxalomesaconate tautomerase [Salinimonas lutimaris]|uniref:4-oxalomesaconate tautomerase n=1 Tax=Salinimonas lutimaris TaxID=914153 RepID=UPI0010C0B6E5|nr:4-oxalomesaconate tautomerase [Salinimonas lutimaris]
MKAIAASLMRGGTSKGLFFLASDLPADTALRDQYLLRAMGSPDNRQIDGVGGANPLTSKVAIVSPSDHPGADVDYLFLQVSVDCAQVSDTQNCGNMLAAVGPFAIEQGLVSAGDEITEVRIRMVNTDAFARATVQTPGGQVTYYGDAVIDGVPGSSAPVLIDFQDIAGSSCGALFPTGHLTDTVDDIQVTCIDNGMPVVLMDASALGVSGTESPAELEADQNLKARVERIRLAIAPRMNLGDVTHQTIPKMCLLSHATHAGVVSTRTFIPHRVHDAIGVLGSVSVATACAIPGTVAAKYVDVQQPGDALGIEHPTGLFSVAMQVSLTTTPTEPVLARSALLRTARLLMRGELLIPTDNITTE